MRWLSQRVNHIFFCRIILDFFFKIFLPEFISGFYIYSQTVFLISLIKRRIKTSLCNQVRVITQFYQFPFTDYRNAVRIAYGGKAVSDDDGGASFAQTAQCQLNAPFGFYIHS